MGASSETSSTGFCGRKAASGEDGGANKTGNGRGLSGLTQSAANNGAGAGDNSPVSAVSLRVADAPGKVYACRSHGSRPWC